MIIRGEITISLDNVGKKIKQVRLKQKKTQQQIADTCNISKSLLSKIENGQTNSAIATLSKISKALEVSLSWLLEDDEEKELVISKQAERQAKIGDEHMGYSFELLANRSPYTGVEPTIVHVTPKNVNLRIDTYTHSHDEFIYVLEGAMELSYNGEKHFMKAGDSANFKGTNPHLFIPVDNEGARVLTLFIEAEDERRGLGLYDVVMITITLLFVGALFKFILPGRGIRQLSIHELHERLKADNVQFIDVRNKEMYEHFHIYRFINIPLNELKQRVDELEEHEKIVVICQRGSQSNRATKRLKRMGFQDVEHVRAGITSWQPMAREK